MDRHGLAIGLFVGALGVVASGLLRYMQRGQRQLQSHLGLLVALAGLLALELDTPFGQRVPFVVVLAISLLGLAGMKRRSGWRGALYFGPGAALLGFGGIEGISFTTHVALGTMCWIGAIAATDFEAHHKGDGFAIWFFGIAGLVPALLIDGGTEPGWLLAGLCAAMVPLVLPRPVARIGRSGAAPLVGVYLWVGVLVSDNRATRLAAVFVGLGMLLCEPLARLLRGQDIRVRKAHKIHDRSIVVTGTGVSAQVVIAVLALRFCSRWASGETALLVALGILAVATAIAIPFVPSPARRVSHVASKRRRIMRIRRTQLLKGTASPAAPSRQRAAQRPRA